MSVNSIGGGLSIDRVMALRAQILDAYGVATACLLGLLSTTGASLPYPILPPLFAGVEHAGSANGLTSFLGLPPKLLFAIALMVNPIGLLIGTAVLGSLSDRFGRRPLLLWTAAGAAVGHVLTAWALAVGSYPLFLLARFGTGLLEGQGAIVRAMLADRLEGPVRNHALSWLNGSFTLGWLFGPLLAGLTIGFGLTVPFYIAAGALLLGEAITWQELVGGAIVILGAAISQGQVRGRRAR